MFSHLPGYQQKFFPLLSAYSFCCTHQFGVVLKKEMNDFQSNGTWGWRCLPKNLVAKGNSLSFTTRPQTDFWYTPELHNDNGHFFFAPIDSSFVATTQVCINYSNILLVFIL